MVFPNFFITFVRHSFHTSHPCTSPSRERRHRPAPPYHQAPHSLMAHALPRYAHATLSRAAPRKGAMLTRHAHATHPRPSQHPPTLQPLAKGYATRAALSHSTHAPHTTTLAKGYATRAALPHSTHALPPPQRAMPRTRPTRKNAAMLFLASPLLSKKKERASTTKILHITILHVTFTRIGVKTTQKSEAIFSFID